MTSASPLEFVTALTAISQQRADLGFYLLREMCGDDFCMNFTQEQRNMYIREVDNAWKTKQDPSGPGWNLLALTIDGCGLPDQQPALDAKELVEWLVRDETAQIHWKNEGDWVPEFPKPETFIHRHAPGEWPSVILAFDGMLPAAVRGSERDRSRSLFARTVVTFYFQEEHRIEETEESYILHNVHVTVSYENTSGRQRFPESSFGDVIVDKSTSCLQAASLR